MISSHTFHLPVRLWKGPVRTQWPDATRAPSAFRSFSTTPSPNAKSKIGARAHKARRTKDRKVWTDPYTIRLAAAKKAALVARQTEFIASRREALGNPIHGVPEETPFVRSLKLAMPAEQAYSPINEDGTPKIVASTDVDISKTSQAEILAPQNTGVATPDHLNNFLSPSELADFTQRSSDLLRPLPNPNPNAADSQAEADAARSHEISHAARTAALARITSIENTNSHQRSQINVQRMIDEFGRHTTDSVLRPRTDRKGETVRKERIGPDTGSSEVQIGILTAKIKTLAARYAGRQKNDKMNKRNLRLLVHRRQKLLRYFQRKDRAGERWRNLIEKLGLTPATWEGEIEVR